MEQFPFFVYGTLIPGQPNDFYWRNRIQTTAAAHFTPGVLVDFGHFPMLLEDRQRHNESIVKGLLITVDSSAYEPIVTDIDQLEQYDPANQADSPYLRRIRPIVTDGSIVLAWVYVGQPQFALGKPEISDGDWVAHWQRKVTHHDPDPAQWWEKHDVNTVLERTR